MESAATHDITDKDIRRGRRKGPDRPFALPIGQGRLRGQVLEQSVRGLGQGEGFQPGLDYPGRHDARIGWIPALEDDPLGQPVAKSTRHYAYH